MPRLAARLLKAEWAIARETKVGLLVGLCVILLIGIIVSDHLSVVQHQDPAQLTEMAATAQSGLTDQGSVHMADANSATAPPTRTQVLPGLPGADANHQGQIFSPGQPIPPSVPNKIDPPHAPNVTVAVGGQQPGAPANPQLASTPTPQQVQVLDTHVVKHGDTLFRLSKYYYHRGDLWEAIEKANPNTVGPKGQLKDGSSLMIPVMAEANGSPTTGDAVPAPRPLDSQPAGLNGGGTRVVQVRPNDTLATLAARYLGARERWHEILELNRDQLRQASGLRIGMRLRLPDIQSAITPSDPQPTAIARGPMSNGPVVSVAGRSFTSMQTNTPVSLGDNGRPSTPWGSVTNNSTTPIRPAVQRVYTVQPSDSLQGIAAKTLGDPDQAQRIYDANRGVLAGQTQLQIGQQLVIPAIAVR